MIRIYVLSSMSLYESISQQANIMSKNQMTIKDYTIINYPQRLRNYLVFYKKRLSPLQKQCDTKTKTIIELVGNLREDSGGSNSEYSRIFNKQIRQILKNQLQVIGLMKEKEETIAQFRQYMQKEEEKFIKIKRNIENLIQLKQKKSSLKTFKFINKNSYYIDQMNQQASQDKSFSTQRSKFVKERIFFKEQSQSDQQQYTSSPHCSSLSQESNIL